MAVVAPALETQSRQQLNLFQVAYYYYFRAWILLLLIFPAVLHGQLPPTAHEFHWTSAHDTLTRQATIIPNTVTWKLNHRPVEIPFILSDNSIIVNSTQLQISSVDTLLLTFSTLPFSIHHSITALDTSETMIIPGSLLNASYEQPIIMRPPEKNTGLLYQGALTRGFSIGNNQSLVFDSELNFQINGLVGDGYAVKAAITDRNLPIQPDGTTQQLQEFDNVFIELRKHPHTITAGDIHSHSSGEYFMRFSRKLKGAAYEFQHQDHKQHWDLRASTGVAKGRFIRQSIIPAEGNQGPYPLRGDQGESFILVLAGSERVYIDGRLLIRGEDADYVMDYNQGEITFTRQWLINARHRIVIEFEYAQYNYQKSNMLISGLHRGKNTQHAVSVFRERDSKLITGDLVLTPEDVQLLSDAGDIPGPLYRPGISNPTTPFNSNIIYYFQKDTVVDQHVYVDILEWTGQPREGLIIANFTDVGPGQGDYIIDPDPSPNGRVYQWIAPDPSTGLKRGQFAPVIPLPIPQQKQFISIRGLYSPGKHNSIRYETGISMNDMNRYSSLGDQDNTGMAIRIQYADTVYFSGQWKILPLLTYEQAGAHFRTIDPYRNPEFSRDWNLSQGVVPTAEKNPSAHVGIEKGKSLRIQYGLQYLQRREQYEGTRHVGNLIIDTTGWLLEAALITLQANDQVREIQFLRPRILLQRQLLKKSDWFAGLEFFRELNKLTQPGTSELLAGSFREDKRSVFINNGAEHPVHLRISYQEERPQRFLQQQLLTSEFTKEWNANLRIRPSEHVSMAILLRHRDVQAMNSSGVKSGKHLLGRSDITFDAWNRGLISALGYEVSSGQEPRQAFTYVRVPKGEGNFIWIDDGDGMEEIQEFELTSFPDLGEYIRIAVFNNEFIATRILSIQATHQFEPRRFIAQGMLSKIALQSSFDLTRKIREDADSPYWNPFYTLFTDTTVLLKNEVFRNILYWNRGGTAYDIQISQLQQSQQYFQTSGFESRQTIETGWRGRLQLGRKTDLIFGGRIGHKENKTQYFASRNYFIAYSETGPEVNLIIDQKMRLTGLYKYTDQRNNAATENLFSHKISLDAVWHFSPRADIGLSCSGISIQYSSTGNQHVDFAMLQGLQDGANFLWSARLDTRLNETILLTLQYLGRKTGDLRPVHTGNASVKAIF